MKIPKAPVNPWVEVPLFGPPAVALVMEVLVDRDEESVVISLFARDPGTDTLIAFSSRKVVGFDRVEDEVRTAGREFTQMLKDHTAPFA